MVSSRQALIGTYTTRTAARGVYLVAVHDGGTIDVQGVLECADPSFIVLHPRRPIAYAVNERDGVPGGLSVIAVDAAHDGLQLVSEEPLAGTLPCHLALSSDARTLVVAHYGSAHVEWLALDAEGMPTGLRGQAQHRGSSVHPRRQSAAHAHSVRMVDADIYVADLGLDAVVHYRQDTHGGLSERSRCKLHAGAGPRHLCAGADGAHVWVCNELDNTVSTLIRASDGSLREVDSTSSLPTHFGGRSACSEIACHPNGRWLYVGNRGHDSIVQFVIAADGALRASNWTASGGVHPRHFALRSDGAVLLAANRDTGTLQCFVLDQVTGALQRFGPSSTAVPAPVCVCWL